MARYGRVAPLRADHVVGRQIGRRKTAAQPKLAQRKGIGTRLTDVKTSHFQGHRTAQQRFARVHHARRGTAQQQVLAVLPHALGPVHQHSQRLCQLGQVLHFIDHHQALQVSQGQQRLHQALARDRVFEVEVVGAGDIDKLARQGGFAHLARPDHLYGAKRLQQLAQLLGEVKPFDQHPSRISDTMKIGDAMKEFHDTHLQVLSFSSPGSRATSPSRSITLLACCTANGD